MLSYLNIQRLSCILVYSLEIVQYSLADTNMLLGYQSLYIASWVRMVREHKD